MAIQIENEKCAENEPISVVSHSILGQKVFLLHVIERGKKTGSKEHDVSDNYSNQGALVRRIFPLISYYANLWSS